MLFSLIVIGVPPEVFIAYVSRLLKAALTREIALGYQSARVSGLISDQSSAINSSGSGIKVRILNDRVAGAKLAHTSNIACQLLGILALHVQSMILVEVIELVVKIDWLGQLL